MRRKIGTDSARKKAESAAGLDSYLEHCSFGTVFFPQQGYPFSFCGEKIYNNEEIGKQQI